jgi:hypothetical protein
MRLPRTVTVKEIVLTNGMVALIDDEDYERVSQHTWIADYRKCSHDWTPRAWIGGKYVLMSRFILQPPDDVNIDHANHNPLDNRRENMRPCNHQQNAANRPKPNRKPTARSSRFKGVVYDPQFKRWRARIGIDYKQMHLGTFATETEAARAYDRAAREHFGEFAYLNLPEQVA